MFLVYDFIATFKTLRVEGFLNTVMQYGVELGVRPRLCYCVRSVSELPCEDIEVRVLFPPLYWGPLECHRTL